MKGVIMAGGTGSRLLPVTLGVNKHLLPVYRQPMIYYPIQTLYERGIFDILIVTRPQDIKAFAEAILWQFGDKIDFQFMAQKRPAGVGQVFELVHKFVGKEDVELMLGDNILFPTPKVFMAGSYIFTTNSNSPEQFGVVFRHPDGSILNIEEKPQKFNTNEISIGLYHYSNSDFQFLLRRWEYNISDCNNQLIPRLKSLFLDPRVYHWQDCGTWESIERAESDISLSKLRKTPIPGIFLSEAGNPKKQ